MTKIIPILSGRCLVVELPENYTLPEIISNYWRDNRGCDRLRWSCPRPDGGWLKTMQRRLPPGNWRIIGMLNEVTEEQAFDIVDWYHVSDNMDLTATYAFKDYVNGEDDAEDFWDEYSLYTALESFYSLLKSEGVYTENPYGEKPDKYAFMATKIVTTIEFDKWQEAQSRVLDRSRCLLLGRED